MMMRLSKVPRIALILCQNVCHVFAYLVTTLIVLHPLKYIHRPLYLTLENIFYNFTLYTVSTWSWTGRIRVHEHGDRFDNLDQKQTQPNCSKEDADSPSGTGEWTDSIATSMIDHCDKVRSSKTNHNNNQLNPSRRRKEVKLLVISNHQETADVPLMFQMFTGYPQNVLLWVMDAMFKHTHFGWVSWIHGDYFIKPGAFESNHLTKHCLENMDKNTIILFPEGGFRYKKAASSKRYSEKMNLPCLKNLVWPRFGAFQDLIDKRIGITHFMDVTIIYPNIQKPFTMIDVLLGVDSYTPVYMIYRVYDLQDIEPTNEWLNELWKQKDEMISSFYEDPERVLQKYPLIRRVELNWRQLWMVNVVYFTMAAFYVYVIRCLWSLAF